MTRSITYARYSIFFMLAVCFAVQSSIAAWNLRIEQTLTSHSQLDSYLIFCGAFGLLVIFPIVLIDITRKNAVVARVWFEISWLALFFVLEIAGAAAVTALLPQLFCSSAVPELRDPACPSTNVLIGITWTTVIIILFHMTSLVVCAILHHDESPQVWQTGVRDFPWFEQFKGSARILNSPCSPKRRRSFVLKPGQNTIPSMAAPKPKRAVAPPLWTTYEVEHLPDVSAQEKGLSRAPAQPSRVMQQVAPRPIAQASLYPSHLKSTTQLPTAPSRGLSDSLNHAQPTYLPPSSRTQNLPLRLAQPEMSPVGPSSPGDSPTTPQYTGGSRRHPRGARPRPPPLDLSQISTLK